MAARCSPATPLRPALSASGSAAASTLTLALLLTTVNAAPAADRAAADRPAPITAIAIGSAERAVAALEIANLMGRYAACARTECADAAAALFALGEDDVRISAPQRIAGPAEVRRYLRMRAASKPTVPVAPIIEIAGDGQTARGAWTALVVVASGDATGGSRSWQRYGVDFIRTPAGWRIWHLQLRPVWWRGGSGQAAAQLPLPRPYYTFDSAEAY
jgi:SnoaL-like domain